MLILFAAPALWPDYAKILPQALAEAGLAARVAEVAEDKKRGLVARIATTGTVDDAALAALLGQYPPAWERMG